MTTRASPYSIRRVAASASGSGAPKAAAAELFIYGEIGQNWWDAESVSGAAFVKEIAALDVDAITVRIMSYGGSVVEGVAIYNALKRHKARVTICIDSIAASIASLIAMAGDDVEIAENAMLMIHAPWGISIGNAQHMREYADVLDKYSDAMASSYMAKSGKSREEIDALLKDGEDHYFTADEAVANGFADRTTAALPVAASIAPDAIAARHPSFATYARARLGAAAPSSTPSQPAAAAAPITTEQSPMTTPVKTEGNPAAAVDENAVRARALAEDKQRRADIAAQFAPFADREDLRAMQRQCEDDIECTPIAAGQKILAALAKNQTPAAGSYVATVEAEADKQIKVRAQVIAARAGLEAYDRTLPYRGDSMLDHAKASLKAAGVNFERMDKLQIVASAFTHGSSDFPKILENIATKAALKGYEEAPETFDRWTSKGTLSDFKQATRAGLNLVSSLRTVRPGAEYKYVTVGEKGEPIILVTYGEKFALTRQAIINDDLSEFSKLPRSLGRAARSTIGDLVYGVINGPYTMTSDGVALFHETHNNLAGSGTAISTTSVAAVRTAMARQKDPTAKRADGSAKDLSIPLRYLLVAPEQFDAALQVSSADYEVSGSKNLTVPNTVKGAFEIVQDSRLPAGAWYGAADGNLYDTIEVAYLDGNETPYLEAQQGWEVDGMEWKVRIDAGVSALDFRGLYKNPGAV